MTSLAAFVPSLLLFPYLAASPFSTGFMELKGYPPSRTKLILLSEEMNLLTINILVTSS
jgi:hypothetical protein